MTYLKLYRGSDIIGIVTEPEKEGPETIADLKFTEAAAKHKELLDYMMKPRESIEDPPTKFNFFEDWFMEDENGVVRPISPPAFYDGGTNLSWRWRR